MKKRIFTGLVLGAMMMGTLTGCGQTNDVEQSEKKAANSEVIQSVDVELDVDKETVDTDNNQQIIDKNDTQIEDGVSTGMDASDTAYDLEDGIVYNICQSQVFTEDEMKYGAEFVIASFGVYFPECELVSVSYDDIFSSSQDDINKQQYGEDDYVVFTTDFKVPADYTDGPLNAGETYEDYQWILNMNEAGQWELVSCGYN